MDPILLYYTAFHAGTQTYMTDEKDDKNENIINIPAPNIYFTDNEQALR